jgi:hypothetical protein
MPTIRADTTAPLDGIAAVAAVVRCQIRTALGPVGIHQNRSAAIEATAPRTIAAAYAAGFSPNVNGGCGGAGAWQARRRRERHREPSRCRVASEGLPRHRSTSSGPDLQRETHEVDMLDA